MQEVNLDFLEERRTGIGGSDAGKVCGKSNFGGPHDVYLSKIQEVTPSARNERQDAGIFLEAGIAEWYHHKYGVKTIKPVEMYRHPELTHMICHLDGLVYNGSDVPVGIAEFKNVGVDKAWEWGEAEDDAPAEYILQCLHNLFVASGYHGIDFPYCELGVCIGGNELRRYRIEKHSQLTDTIITQEKDLWFNHILPKNPPPIDGSDGSLKTLQHTYPRDDGSEINGDAMASEWAEKYLLARDAKKDAEAQMKEAQAFLQDQIGVNKAIITEHGRFSWTSIAPQEAPDYRAIVEELSPADELIARYTKVIRQGYRRFNAPRRRK